jgi:hypothetical protein
MIETFLKLMINELGPVGLLIIGLYFVLGRHLQKICRHIQIMNHNSEKILEAIERSTDRLCDKINGKN